MSSSFPGGRAARAARKATTVLEPTIRAVRKKAGSVAFTTFMKVYRSWAKKNMALPEETVNHDCFAMTVDSVTDIASHLRRITCHAAAFATLPVSGVDEYFGLVIPPAGKKLVLPEASDSNIRAALADIDEEHRPILRWYTIRHLDREHSTMTFDIVTHGRSGPGSSWALDATAGQVVGYRSIGATYQNCTGAQLLVADATSLPALHAILESFSASTLSKAHVIIAIPNDDVVESTLDQYTDKLASLDVIYTDVDAAPSKVSDKLAEIGPLDLDYAWACGEASIAKQVRRILVKDWGVEKTRVLFSGYWRKDKAHG